VQAQYSADIETLRRFLSDAEGEKMDVIQKIKPMVMDYGDVLIGRLTLDCCCAKSGTA
jgi:hypothetical protein